MRKFLSDRVGSRAVGLAAAVALCVSGGRLFGQTGRPGGGSAAPPKKKSQLEDLLERVSANHPDVKVAEAKLRTAMADRIRKALDKPLTVRFNGETLGGILDALGKRELGVAIAVKDFDTRSLKLTGELKDLPLGAVLQWVEDNAPGQRWVVREYGLLLAPKHDRLPGAVPLVEFWKGGAAKPAAKPPRK